MVTLKLKISLSILLVVLNSHDIVRGFLPKI